MKFRTFLAGFAIVVSALSTPSQAGPGDLLVAPTRIVINGSRGTQVLLNNIGNATATYRISLELRRMLPDGSIEEVATTAANEKEKRALEMISYAPRRVTLAPNQPQAIRIGVRAPQDLPDGEYRAHMLFRAIPDAKPATAPASASQGVSIALTPIYGVTIPVIVRRGTLTATAAMANPRIIPTKQGPMLALSLSREGARSTYGIVRVLKPGQAKPVFEVRGVAVYPEISKREVELDIPDDLVAVLKGPATIQYVEEADAGGKLLAEVKTSL